MGSFTEDFFKNKNNLAYTPQSNSVNNKITTTKKTTTSKKKKDEEEIDDFTSSFFDNYNSSNNDYYTEDFVNEYNSFIDRLNQGIQDRYNEQVNKTEAAVLYYSRNQEALKKERSEELIYRWDVDTYNDYGSVPKQDKNGYLQQKDKDGNIYWVDIKNDLLYDANYNLVNDERLTDEGYKKLGLKYQYNKYSNNKLDSSKLSKADKLGLVPIKETRYMSIINEEKESPKLAYKQPFEKKDFNDTLPYKNDYLKEQEKKKENEENLAVKIYQDNFEKLNKAIKNGDLTTANNALQTINQMYFGHEYNDGFVATLSGNVESNNEFFYKRFDDNVKQLEVINNSIKNTSDSDVLYELNKEKDKLELENTLIQYNKVCATQSMQNKLDKVNKIEAHKDEVWDKVETLWSQTFDEFDDGYQFGDGFKTIKNVFNNTIQSIASVAVQTNDGIQAIESLALSDMDDSEFKDKWMPAIMDVATYIIPYVGQARFIINLAEPTAVVESFVTQEGSATIESSNGEPRVANAWNAIGGIANIAANMLSNYIFKGMRVRLGEAGTRKIYENTARGVATLILKDATGEASEEFVQTFAEVLQNAEDTGTIDWKETFHEGLEAALIAFITTGVASGTSIAIDAARGGDINKIVMEKAEISNTSQDGELENVKINKDLSDNKVVYSSNDIKEQEDIYEEKLRSTNVKVDEDEKVAQDIAEQLSNNQIISILSSDSITKDTDIKLDDTNGSSILADSVIDSNTKTVLVGSKEMETYLKSLRPDLVTYVFDPNSKTFMDDIRAYVNDVAKQNIVPKNVSDFTVNDYKLTPDEMVTINKMVNEYTNKANLLDSVNNPDTYKLQPAISISDITDSDINTIFNAIKTRFLNDIDKGKYSKETAQKEFKSLSNKLSDYVLKTKENRTYIKDARNNIVVFSKKGNNIYEAVNTMPYSTSELSVLANVKSNGNIINGNINQKVDFAKKQLNAVNTLIDKLKLKGDYLTPDSTYKNVASLVKANRDLSGEILQALNADGLVEGKNKVTLYTAHGNLDNANFGKAIKNTSKYLKSQEFKKDLNNKSETTAPSEVKLPVQETKVDINEKPINVEEYASNPENPSELNNIELEKLFDDSFKDLEIKNKVSKDITNELKDIVKNAVFDGYSHITDIANANEDYGVKNAIYDLQAVASDAQTMITGAQMKDGEVIGKSLKQIYSDNNLKSKKDKELFDKVMLHALNAEREKAGVEKIFPNISAKQSEKIVQQQFEKHPNIKNASLDFQRFNNNLLDMLVDSGVVSKKQSDVLKERYKYYMPIYTSDLSSFVDLGSEKYMKSLSLDNSIKDATKTGKQILSLEKSMENKVYNVLSAIAKNKVAQEISKTTNYEGDSDLLFYNNGEVTKTKVKPEILTDIKNNTASHVADIIHELPVFKQLIDMSNLSYKFILDPVYQLKNITIDFADSAMIYSKDKKHFIPNYIKAIYATANNSELYHECLANGLGNTGEGWNAPKVEYDTDGNVKTKQNKFQRVYANLEAMPKMAEYLSLKDKYMKEARLKYENGDFKDSKKSLKQIQDETLKRAMLDASDVNLNFNRGGKVVKAMSKSGFKFLNAGIQGFDKFVTHVGEGVKTPKGMGSLLLEFTAVGATTTIANALLNGDDEDYDKLPYYYKNNYYMFKIDDGKYFRIPKGRVQTLYNVLFEYSTGIRKEDIASDYIESLRSAFDMAVLPPGLENASPIGVYKQLLENKDAFGNEIYSEKYDTPQEKAQKTVYHLLSNYFGRYGRMVKDITDGDSTTDIFTEFDYYKDTTKADRHYNTALKLVEYYQNEDNVKTLNDKAMKKYIDTQNYALRTINSEINNGKSSGQTTQDLKMKYAARNDLLKNMINNYKNFDKEEDEDGNVWYYFDEHCFMYNKRTQKFVKKY